MNARQLIEHCERQDIHFEVIGPDELKCSYPRGALQNNLQNQLRDKKTQIIKILLSAQTHKFVYRVTVDGKRITVLSPDSEEAFKVSVYRKFGGDRVHEIELTPMRLLI